MNQSKHLDFYNFPSTIAPTDWYVKICLSSFRLLNLARC